jgi:hypothetical protein
MVIERNNYSYASIRANANTVAMVDFDPFTNTHMVPEVIKIFGGGGGRTIDMTGTCSPCKWLFVRSILSFSYSFLIVNFIVMR